MFWLTVVSSVLSIASFAISFFEYFSKWRPYLLHVAFLLGGFTAGVILSMGENTVQHFTQAQLIYLIALVSLIALATLFIHRYMGTSTDPVIVALIVFAGMGYFMIRILNSVETSQGLMRPSDYIIMSDHYIQTGDYSRAAELLKKYKELDASNLSKAITDSLDKRIDVLYLKGIQNAK